MLKFNRKNHNRIRYRIGRSGFTLIELLAVVAIMAIVVRAVGTTVNLAIKKSRDARRIADFKNIEMALSQYHIDKSIYPIQTNGDYYVCSYQPGFLSPLTPTYTLKVPHDPINDAPAVFDWFVKDTHYYAYYYYLEPTTHAVYYGCGNVTFAVLGIRLLEGGPSRSAQNAYCGPPKPFSCPPWGIPNVCRDWSLEFDYSKLYYD